jgi:hypothetical protein
MGFVTSYVDQFPHTVLMVDDKPRLVVHKESDGAVWLSLDIFGADGKIIATLDEDGFTVRPGSYFKLTKRDKSSLRIVDEYDDEVLNVRYVNPHAIWFNALLRYPGSNPVSLKGSAGGGICTAHGGTAEVNIKTKPGIVRQPVPPNTDAAEAQPQPPVSTESIRPHLQTRLVIDSIPQDADIEFHIEVENISQLQIDGLRAGMRTTEMTTQDVSMPLPPTLPPGGRLSIPGMPSSGLKKYGVLFLDLDYESKAGGKTNKFASSYSFLVRPVDMKPQSLLPTTWQEQAGVILGPEQKTMEAALKTLAGRQGTMLIVLPLLRPDGSPNLLVMTNNKRKFSFDGGSRSVSFTTTTSTGSLKTISYALPDGSYEPIVIGCLWDNQKDVAKLIIGGKEFP